MPSLASMPPHHKARFVARTALLFGVIAALVCPAELGAATKYVAKTGNDRNDGGSIETAYLTIAKGLQEIGPGGRLYIGGGTYTEAVLNTIPSGTSNTARTIVTNHEHEVVIIRPNAAPPRVLEFNRAASYITVAANARGQIVLDGHNVKNNVVKFSSASSGGGGDWPSYIRLENLEIKDCPNSGVLGYPKHCEFIGLNIHHAGRSVYDHGMYIAGCDNVIDSCDIHSNYARGIQIFMSGKHSDPAFASRNLVRNCRIHHNGLVAGTLKPGIDADSGTENQIYNNLIYNNGQFGLMIQISGAGNVVFNNTFFNNGTAGIFIKSSAGTGTILRNNLAWGNGAGAQFVDEKGGAITSNNLWDGSDPHFASTDPDNPAFLKLSASSTLAIDQGTSEAPVSGTVTRDFWGTPRPQGAAIDLGAAEF